jgi:hypothetical protein
VFIADARKMAYRDPESMIALSGNAPLSLRGALATRQSATAQVLDGIAASLSLLAMTMNRACRFPVSLKAL